MGDQVMARMRRPILNVGLMVSFFVFLLAGVLSFSPAYGGPETLGASPDAQSGVRAPRDIPLGVEEEMEEDIGKADADALVMATDEKFLPVGMGEVNSSAREAAPLRQKSGFDAFNTRYQNKWAATFSKETGTVRVLYGAASRPYKNGPEGVARGFLKDTSALFGLKSDLSDLTTQRVDRTPTRDHVRMQQTYNGVPIDGVFVLVHATPQGRVTMIQNDYQQGFQPANGQTIAEEAATEIARTDLQASLGKDAVLAEPQAGQWIAPYKGGYYYIWRVAISTQNPIGYWVYHVDSDSGKILYKANEILSTRNGTGRAYKTNADWHLNKISTVTLTNLYDSRAGNTGYLWGPHADIYDYVGSDPKPPDYKYLYDPVTQKPWFDATHAFYQLNTIWSWWNTKVIKRYYDNKLRYAPATFSLNSIQTIVNVSGLCNAFYNPGTLGFVFGDENSCAVVSEDLVIDNDVVRHEFTHAVMDWCGFDSQFGGDVDNYGRAMGEGNADWFAYLNTPNDPYMADVAWAWSPAGYLRNLDNTRMYPYDVDDPSLGVPEEHYTGEIWGGYLYDLYRVLKGSALSYVYHAFFYFTTAGGHRGLVGGAYLPDFFDGIQAQIYAEIDLTGQRSCTAKAWGSMASRGINAFLRAPYSHPTDYFGTGVAGSDLPAMFYWFFPPSRSITTKGNILLSGDQHEYPITVNTTRALKLTATVTAKPGGAINPQIHLYDMSGTELVPVAPPITTLLTVVFTYPNLPGGIGGARYVIVVTGNNTAAARGYYDFKITLQ